VKPLTLRPHEARRLAEAGSMLIVRPVEPQPPMQREIEVINLNARFALCCMCGKETPCRWGLPVDSETGEIVANDFPGEWGGVPACKDCWKAHESGAFVGQYPKF
jgi:hypothetical protein